MSEVFVFALDMVRVGRVARTRSNVFPSRVRWLVHDTAGEEPRELRREQGKTDTRKPDLEATYTTNIVYLSLSLS